MEIDDLRENTDKNERDRTKRFLFCREDVFPVPF